MSKVRTISDNIIYDFVSNAILYLNLGSRQKDLSHLELDIRKIYNYYYFLKQPVIHSHWVVFNMAQ